MNFLKYTVWMVFAVCFVACSSSSDEEPEASEKPENKQIPINLSIGCGVYAKTDPKARIMDTYFEVNDAIGLYVVSGSGLIASGNYVNNVRCMYTSSAAWKPDMDLYWKDESTASDFYAYYPYTSGVSNALTFDFQVKADQSDVKAYKQSDLAWGRTLGVKPTEAAVNIQLRHLISNLVIKVLPGNGFTQEKLDASEVSVKVDGLQTAVCVNLSDGLMVAAGQVVTHYPCFIDRQYKLLVVPQNTVEPAVVSVTVNGREFNLKQQLAMKSGHRYTIPVTVSKTSNGINVGIDGWIDDGLDYGGVAE